MILAHAFGARYDLPIPLLLQASQDPSVLGSQVTVTGSGQ